MTGGTQPGFTVMINSTSAPTQVPIVGVTVIVALMGDAPVLVAVNAMFPVPEVHKSNGWIVVGPAKVCTDRSV